MNRPKTKITHRLTGVSVMISGGRSHFHNKRIGLSLIRAMFRTGRLRAPKHIVRRYYMGDGIDMIKDGETRETLASGVADVQAVLDGRLDLVRDARGHRPSASRTNAT